MNSIGACPPTAAFVRVLILALCSCAAVHAADCGAGLTPQERVSQFKQVDHAAEAAMQQHRPADAVQMYEQAVCLVPNSARGFYGLGVAEAAVGNYPKARESLRMSDRLQPTTGMPLLMQVRVNFSLQDLDALKTNLREAASRFPADSQLHTALARFLAEQNLLVLALAEAMRSQQASADSNSKLQLAILENTIGAYEDAIHDALAVEQSTNAQKELRAAAAGIAGLSFESLHQTERGIRYLKEAIALDPSQENSYLALADLLEQAQKYKDAVAALEEGRRNLPNSLAILLPLGTDLIRAERYKEGIEVLRALLRETPNTNEAYVSLAEAARKMGEPDQELIALRDLLRQNPSYPMIHILIARALLNKQPPDYPEVLAELSRAAERDPADPDVFFLRGKVYASIGRYDDAVPALQHSIDLRPMEPSPYYQLARVYQKLGKADMARQEFERVRYLESSDAKQ